MFKLIIFRTVQIVNTIQKYNVYHVKIQMNILLKIKLAKNALMYNKNKFYNINLIKNFIFKK